MSTKKRITNNDPLDGEVLEIDSTGGSIKVPSLTTTQIGNIAGGSPRAGLIVHDSTEDIFKGSNNGSAFVSFGGGGSGGGGKNYFPTPSFDSLTSVSAYDDGGAFVDGTGGSPTIVTGSAETGADVLEGDQSLVFNKQFGDGSGQGLAFTTTDIDRIDQGSQLFGSFAFDSTDSNYPSGDIELFAYDVAAGEELPLSISGYEDKTLPGTKGILRFKVDTTTATTGAIRICLHVETDNITGNFYEVFIDEFKLGPQEQVTVMPYRDWKPYTPTFTGLGTVSVSEFYYRQVGDTLEIKGRAQIGTPSANPPTVSLPSGLNLDTAKSSTSGDVFVFGFANRFRDSSTVGIIDDASGSYQAVAYDGSNTDRLRLYKDHGSDELVPQNGSALYNTGEGFSINASVPIAGWGSNAVLGANQKTFWMSEINLIEVSTTPSKFGEYQPLEKDASAITYSDGATPTDPPNSTDGFRVDSVSGTSASTSGRPMAYIINIGKYRTWLPRWWSGTGKDGIISTEARHREPGVVNGYTYHYNQRTGNLFVHQKMVSNSDTRQVGQSYSSYTSAPSDTQTGYFDIQVGESPAQLFIEQAKSEVVFDTGDGHGSTNTKIRNFSNVTTTGSSITGAVDATNGASATINEPGLYSISYSDVHSSAYTMGLSVNSSSLTTNIQSVTLANGKLAVSGNDASRYANVAVTKRFSQGDVIRAHTDGGITSTTDNSILRITKVSP